jgi:GMP synthase (glutamine-hydrolysing)
MAAKTGANSEVLVLQHIGIETPGTIERVLSFRGIRFKMISPYKGQKTPSRLNEAGLVVMGGPMGVYETKEYPFLKDEMKLIENALRQKKPVLGICLGSQLLASVLGARVKKGKKKEIGWYPVRLKPEASKDALWAGAPKSFMGLHWHGDIFELPKKSVALASSDLTRVQAYRYGVNAYGFLFHMEVTRSMIRKWTDVFAGELKREKISGADILRAGEHHQPFLQALGSVIFDRWAEKVSPS